MSDLMKQKSDIADCVKDAADYLCSRGDTMHRREDVEGNARRILYGLSVKGWMVLRRAKLDRLRAENARLRESLQEIASLSIIHASDLAVIALRKNRAALQNKGDE